jgi:hypothetical protein
MAGEYDLEILQGETYTKQFIWKDSAGTEVNLTGYTARMQVRQSKASDDVLLELTTANGRISLGGAAGTIDLNLSATVTAAITWKRGLYDLELVASNGVVRRLLEGEVTVSKEVTR